MDPTLLLYAALALVAGYYLLRSLYFRILVNYDDIPTILVNPLKTTPAAVQKMHMTPLGGMKAYGLVFRTVNWWKPWQRNLTVGDPALLKNIFVSKDWEKFDRQHPASEPHFPYTKGFIHMRNGPIWRETKAIFDRTFATTTVRKYTPILLELRGVMMDQLAKANTDKSGFDIFPIFNYFTFDVITRLAFGAEVRAQTTESGREYAIAFEHWMLCAAKMSSVIQLMGKWALFTVRDVVKQWEADGAKMFGLVRAEKARVARGEKRISILDDAMAIVNSEKVPATMTDQHLDEVFMSLLFGGFDTTTAHMSFLFYELAKRPDLQALIREEVKEAFGNGPVDNLDALESKKVLNACIKETLRRYPSAPFGATRNIFEPFNHTYTGQDGVERTIKFRKGDRLITYIWGIQNFPAFWGKDPSVWYPERFYENASGDSKVGLYAYSPFGNGARRCLGERLALGESRLCLASILQRWEVKLVPETTWSFIEMYKATIRPNKVMVKLVEVGKK